MRFQFPEPQDILIALLLLTLTAWQAQTVLAIVSLLLVGLHHYIIGGIIGAMAAAAFAVRRYHHL